MRDDASGEAELQAFDYHHVDVGGPRANVIERGVFRRVYPGVGLLEVVEFKYGELLGPPIAQYDFNPAAARYELAAVTLNSRRYLLENCP